METIGYRAAQLLEPARPLGRRVLGAFTREHVAASSLRSGGEQLGRCDVERERDLLAGRVAGALDRPEQQRERLLVRRQVRREAAFVAERGREVALLQQRLERVVRLDAPAQGLGEARGADRREHELLHVDVGVGVGAAVEHVHERHRQHVRVGAAHVAVERELGLVGRRLRRRQRHAEDGVGAETALAVGAVEGDELVVEEALVGRVEAHDGIGDLGVDVLDRGADTLAAVAVAAVAQLVRLVRAGAGAARHDGAPTRAREQLDVDLDGRVPPGIEDLAAHDLHDRAHALPADAGATVADVTSEPKPFHDAGPAFNPFASGFAEDPYPHYAELCADNPVQETPLGWWALFRYDDATRLLRDPTLSVEDRSVDRAQPPRRPAGAGAGRSPGAGHAPDAEPRSARPHAAPASGPAGLHAPHGRAARAARAGDGRRRARHRDARVDPTST